MQLSYSWRLLCLALCGAGLLQCLLECLGWLMAPRLLPRTAGSNARQGERALFLLTLFARLGPWLVVLGAWMPAYRRAEDNLSGERVGVLCLAGAAVVAVALVFCWGRAVRSWAGTRRHCAQGTAAGRSPAGLPVLLLPGGQPLVAVAGLFRSRILLSSSLLASECVSEDALETALRHEDAHARQRDNLKLLVLSLLPHLPLATRKRASLGQQWRLAAELAADQEGTLGRPERSVLLAELLVTLARASQQPLPHGSFALLSRGDDLSLRVERLLHRSPAHGADGRDTRSIRLQTACAVALSVATLAVLCQLCTHFGHDATELLLHIG